MSNELPNYDEMAEAPVEVADDDLKSIALLAERQLVLEDWIEAGKAKIKEAEKNLAKIAGELLPDAMRAAKMLKFTLDNGATIEVEEGVYASITKKNQEWCYNWLRDNNQGDLIKNEFKVTFGKGEDEQADNLATHLLDTGMDYNQREFIHPQTLGAFVRTEVANPEVDHDAEWEEKFGVFRKKVAKIERPKT